MHFSDGYVAVITLARGHDTVISFYRGLRRVEQIALRGSDSAYERLSALLTTDRETSILRAPCSIESRETLLAHVQSCAVLGLQGALVSIEVDIGQGLPNLTIVGLPDTAVQEARERVRAAIKNSGCTFPNRCRYLCSR